MHALEFKTSKLNDSCYTHTHTHLERVTAPTAWVWPVPMATHWKHCVAGSSFHTRMEPSFELEARVSPLASKHSTIPVCPASTWGGNTWPLIPNIFPLIRWCSEVLGGGQWKVGSHPTAAQRMGDWSVVLVRSVNKLASFPGPAQLAVACSMVEWDTSSHQKLGRDLVTMPWAQLWTEIWSLWLLMYPPASYSACEVIDIGV